MDRCPQCKALIRQPLLLTVPCEHEMCEKCASETKKKRRETCAVCEASVERYVSSARLDAFLRPKTMLEASEAHDACARTRHKLIARLDPDDMCERAERYFDTQRKYNIIYADPPWRYGPEGARGGTKRHYGTMSDAELMDMPVLGLAAEDAALLLWCTDAMMEKGLRLIEAWGFVYLKFYRYWIKENKNERTIFHGPGNFSRGNIEFVMLGIRGDIKRYEQKDSCMPKPLLSPVQEHSRKPEAMAESIIDIFGDLPRIELFARREKYGWDTWGNETDRFTLGDVLHSKDAEYKREQDRNAEMAFRIVRKLPLLDDQKPDAPTLDPKISKLKTRVRTNTPVIEEMFGKRRKKMAQS